MNKTRKITLSALFLSLAIVLPFLTGQIPEIGKALTPMHFPIIIGSYFIGPVYALIIGFISPLLRMVAVGMPPFPISLIMAFELATYGVVTGLMYNTLMKVKLNSIVSVYISLLIAAIMGRIVFAIVSVVFLENASFIPVFLTTFASSIIGIILQVIFIPILVIRLKDDK
jgi:predicted membrane protein